MNDQNENLVQKINVSAYLLGLCHGGLGMVLQNWEFNSPADTKEALERLLKTLTMGIESNFYPKGHFSDEKPENTK